MSRTVDQTLLDSIANQQGETILRILTWASLSAYNAAPTVPEYTWQTNKFKISATQAEAHLITNNTYTDSDFTVFIIERGASISSTEYVIQSGIYFVREFEETDGRLKITGSSYPNQKIILDGDDTYQNVIEAFCTEIGKTAVFKDTGAAWLGYQFLPAGKQVILNKAERFENLLKQKYIILCYERSPKELVFYHAATEQSAWKDIIFADSQLVLTATSGASEIGTSTDGLAYDKIQAPQYTNAIAYSPTLDLFVAVGNGVSMSSPDGVTWTNRTIKNKNWTGVIWDSNLAKFIAVANGATAISTNGTTWTTTYHYQYDFAWSAGTTIGEQYRSIAWSPELSLFCAVFTNPATYTIATSADGANWTGRNTTLIHLTAITWSPELSLFCAVGDNRIVTSPNGITWTERTPATSHLYSAVVWSPELSLFCAVGQGKVQTSPDGITWTERTGSTAQGWLSIAWSPELSLFCAVASTTTDLMTSPDGINWTTRTAPNANFWSGIAWSPELSLFCAVATGGASSNKVMTSPDGINWTARTEAQLCGAITWSPELSLFMAVGQAGRVQSSPDGITWTTRTAANSEDYSCITWSPELALFIAGNADDYETTNVMTSDATADSYISITNNIGSLVSVGINIARTSSDSITWTNRTIPTGTYHKVIYADSLFVAVGASICATSPDGITWTERTIPAGTYTGLAYSDTLDLFVAVGDNKLATSPNSIDWTSQTPIADLNWQAITWASDLEQFFAIANEGDNRIASSEDGINWQILTTQADYSLTYEDGPKYSIEHGTYAVHFLWRDETASVSTEGDTTNPAWNLGYLESTDDPPATNADPFYKFNLQAAPLRLDITDGDRIHFSPSWTLDPTKSIDAMVQIVEQFDSTKAPAWWQEIKSLAIFESVEGGALPSTIERVSAYTPLVTSGFDNNLDSSVNNLQALADFVDDMPTGEVSQAELDAVEDQITDHIADTTAAHAASAISYAGGTGMSATNVETAIDELATEKVNNTGNETIAGVKTFSSDPLIPDEAYDATAWNGSLEPPTKNAVRDKIESLTTGPTTEEIQDIVGAMFTGNTETGISVTYQDSDGTFDVQGLTPETYDNPLYQPANSPGVSGFTALINGTPTNASNSVVTFDTITVGGAASLAPVDANNLARQVLFNTTRGNFALIVSRSGSTVTVDRNVTTLASPWQDNDSITTLSPTVSGGGFNWVEFEIISSVMDKSAIWVNFFFTNTSGAVNDQIRLHPYESWAPAKYITIITQATAATATQVGLLKINSNRFCMMWISTTLNFIVRAGGYLP